MNKSYYYQYYHFERHHWWFRARAAILKSYIKNVILGGKTDIQILNVGAATGGSTEWLSTLGRVTSIEYDADCIEYVKDKVKFPIEQGTILSLSYQDNTFDLVCAFDVIEHVENDAAAVKELARVCKPGGSILVTVPAYMHLWSQHDVVNQHFRRYTLASVEKVFTMPSGIIRFSSYFNHRLYPIVFIARKFGNLLKRLTKNRTDKSDFETYRESFFGNVFYSIMANEGKDLCKQIKKPYGVSIILQWMKT